MAADVGRDEHAALRHRLERLQRRHELGEPHRQPRIGEHVDQLVVALHSACGTRPVNTTRSREAARRDLRAQRSLPAGRRRPAARAAFGSRGSKQRERLEQQVEPS